MEEQTINRGVHLRVLAARGQRALAKSRENPPGTREYFDFFVLRILECYTTRHTTIIGPKILGEYWVF